MRLKYWTLAVAGILLSVIAISAIPVPHTRKIVAGVDSYDTHRLIFGENTYSQIVRSDYPLLGVGLLLVDIRRSGIPHQIFVSALNNETGDVITRGTITADILADDTYAPITFESPVDTPNQNIRIVVTVPAATNETALGWRYDPQDLGYPRFENDNLYEGSFAFSLIQQVPLRTAVWFWIIDNSKVLLRLTRIFAPLIVFAALASRIGWSKLEQPKKRVLEWAIIGLVVVVAFGVRLYTESHMGGVSGGDPYNYLMISKLITALDNPFAAKRLPGYPLLLTPAVVFPSIDAHTYMRTISIIFSSCTLVLLYAIAQKLRFPWAARLGAVTLLAFQKDFFATSLRPEPYTLFGMLMLATLLLFLSARRPWQQYLFGVLLGYSAMTRQEGFVVAVMFFVMSAVLSMLHPSKPYISFSVASKSIRKILRMFLPALLLVSPFFINNWIQYGNPLYTPYFEGEKLQIVDSWQAFKDASVSTWTIFTSMWKPSWTQLELLLPYDHALIPITLFIVLGWWVFVTKSRAKHLSPPLNYVATILLIAACVLYIGWLGYLAVTDIPDLKRLIPIIIAGVLIFTPVGFLGRYGWRGLLMAALFTSQVLIALWFHPFPKHYQQSYPFMALAIAAILFTVPRHWNAVRRFAALLITGAPFAITSFFLFDGLSTFIDAHNAHAALDSVSYRATRAASNLPGPYLLQQPNLPADIYLSSSLRNHNTISEVDEFEHLLQSTNPVTVVLTTPPDILSLDSESWKQVAEFKSEGKDEVLYTSAVYTKQAP